MEKILLLFDCHLTTKATKQYRLVVNKFLPWYKPDEVILGGDFMDCASLSHWICNMGLRLEGKRYKKELEFAKKEIVKIFKHTKRITWLEGNHENWVAQYVERNPQLEGMMAISNHIDFNKYHINWIPMNHLYHRGKRGKIYFTHGLYTGKYHARQHVESLGCNIVYGHKHSAQTYQVNMKMQKPYMGYSIGCLCGFAPEYLKNRPSGWINQFAICELNDSIFNLTPVNIINNQFIYGGKLWRV